MAMTDIAAQDGPQASGDAITGIDHVVIGVKDLDGARDDFTRLGFTISPRGRHVGWGTANYTVMFENDYLNLMSVVDPSQDLNTLDEFLEEGEGLFRTVFATPDASALCSRLERETGEEAVTTDLGREAEFNGSGPATLRFKIVHLPQGLTPGMRTYACDHLTPKLLRKAEWLSHPNGARRIAQVTVAMEDLTEVPDAYARLFGGEAISGEPKKGTLVVDTGGAKLQFLTPKAFTKEHYDVVLDRRLPLPRLAALTLEVADPEATALYLSGQQVNFVQEPDGTVQVPPEETHGVLMEFARATLA
ncbi:MAG: VOC family protein [Alphaproteobacteria bacterium]|nr:VOC family protein [Alphaproteobacteria bacterium]MCZ6763508.1 VOC family protein [Alphaproteobacteria bacterium]